MAKYEMVAPLSPLEVPVLGQVLTRGEEFDVPADLEPYFDAQPELWRRLDGEPVEQSVQADDQEEDEE